jgi:hypothetical protein
MPWRGRTSRVVKNPGATDNRGRGYVETGNRGYISIVERPFEGAAFVSELGLRLLDADRGHWARPGWHWESRRRFAGGHSFSRRARASGLARLLPPHAPYGAWALKSFRQGDIGIVPFVVRSGWCRDRRKGRPSKTKVWEGITR